MSYRRIDMAEAGTDGCPRHSFVVVDRTSEFVLGQLNQAIAAPVADPLRRKVHKLAPFVKANWFFRPLKNLSIVD